MTSSERDIVADALAEHGMYFHLWIVADNCGMANRDDLPRRRAAFAVRDWCAAQMRNVLVTLSAAVRRDALTAVRDSDQAAADFGRNER